MSKRGKLTEKMYLLHFLYWSINKFDENDAIKYIYKPKENPDWVIKFESGKKWYIELVNINDDKTNIQANGVKLQKDRVLQKIHLKPNKEMLEKIYKHLKKRKFPGITDNDLSFLIIHENVESNHELYGLNTLNTGLNRLIKLFKANKFCYKPSYVLYASLAVDFPTLKDDVQITNCSKYVKVK